MDTTTTAPATPAAEPKQSIGEKVNALNVEKTKLTTELNATSDATAKANVEEQIKVIDRKLRWYAGRAGEGKAAKPARPSTGTGRKSRKAAASTTPAAAQPAMASAANES